MATWREIAPEARDRLLGLYNSSTLEERHAADIGMNLQTLKRRLRDWRKRREYQIEESSIATWFPDSPSQDWEDYFDITTDDYIVISDIEIPDHDPAMLQAALLTAMSKNIKTLIIAGDLLATDNSTLNSWVETWAVGDTLNYEGAIGLTVDILARFLNWFDDIYIIQGNHDDRISRATGGEVWFGMLLREAHVRAQHIIEEGGRQRANVHFSRYSYMYVRTSRGTMYICHQHNYSKTPVKLAQDIYGVINGPDYDPRDLNAVSEKCHVLVTHTHIIQSGFSPEGAREVYGIGCCRDPQKTKYKQTSANKFPEWNQGIFYAKSGYFYNLPRRSTNWLDVLGELSPQAEVIGHIAA